MNDYKNPPEAYTTTDRMMALALLMILVMGILQIPAVHEVVSGFIDRLLYK